MNQSHPSTILPAENRPAWEDGHWQALPSLKDDVSADVCVIGLGGSGLSCVRELTERGWQVVGLDAGIIAGGAAGRNGGFLLAGTADFYHKAIGRMGHSAALAWYRETLDQIQRMVEETPQHIRITGSLRIAASEEEQVDCRQQMQAMLADDLPVEAYEGPEGTGLLIPGDGTFNPLARCRSIALNVQKQGAILFEHSPALQISAQGVSTPAGQVRCHTVVVCVDGGLERILPELAPRVKTLRLQMLATAPTSAAHLPRPVYRRWGYDYWQQLTDGRIALGGFRDHDTDAYGAAEPSIEVQQLLDELLRTHIGVNAEITHRWAAHVGYTSTGMPIMEELRPRIWAMGGYCGTGNVIGAICARKIAEQIFQVS